MQHSFNIEIAKNIGINCAIILEYMRFWIEKNKANKKHFHDGYYWTYNSVRALNELFPYLSQKQISTALKKLEDKGFILKGNYNKVSYDRTMWYAITEKGESILQKGYMDVTEKENRNAEKGEPIPFTNTVNKPFINTVNNIDVCEPCTENSGMDEKPKNKTHKDIIADYTNDKALLDALDGFIEMRKKMKGFTTRALELALKKLDKLGTTTEEKIAIVNQSVMNGWKAFYPLKDKQYPQQQQQSKKGDGSEYAEFDL